MINSNLPVVIVELALSHTLLWWKYNKKPTSFEEIKNTSERIRIKRVSLSISKGDSAVKALLFIKKRKIWGDISIKI